MRSNSAKKKKRFLYLIFFKNIFKTQRFTYLSPNYRFVRSWTMCGFVVIFVSSANVTDCLRRPTNCHRCLNYHPKCSHANSFAMGFDVGHQRKRDLKFEMENGWTVDWQSKNIRPCASSETLFSIWTSHTRISNLSAVKFRLYTEVDAANHFNELFEFFACNSRQIWFYFCYKFIWKDECVVCGNLHWAIRIAVLYCTFT